MAGHTPFSELKAKLLANPAIRARYEAQSSEYRAEYDRIVEELSLLDWELDLLSD